MKPIEDEADERFESWWRSLPMAYDIGTKELFRNAYLTGFTDAIQYMDDDFEGKTTVSNG